jgi:hypothetical protein
VTVEALRAAAGRGLRHEFIFFWGPEVAPDGATGPGSLSQWWPAPFDVDGVRYATAEHFMMAEKARLFGDAAICEQILSTPDPAVAKALGRDVRGFDRRSWEEHRVAIVVRGNTAKFAQHPSLGAYLVRTAGRVLVEASPEDRIWGIGLGVDDPAARDPRRWHGRNLMGFALMGVRATLTDREL